MAFYITIYFIFQLKNKIEGAVVIFRQIPYFRTRAVDRPGKGADPASTGATVSVSWDLSRTSRPEAIVTAPFALLVERARAVLETIRLKAFAPS